MTESLEQVSSKQENRRKIPRYNVDQDAAILLVSRGANLTCRILDLSLGGCLMRTKERYTAGTEVRVEVSFRVRGFAFRFCGLTQWSDGRYQVGIRFVDVTSRRSDELAEALGEFEEEQAAKAPRQSAPTHPPAAVAGMHAVAPSATAGATPPKSASGGLPFMVKGGSDPLPQPPSKRERRTDSRHEVDTQAVIHLINIASRLNGRILDLSVNGCRIQTEQKFPVGIYTRAEIEFRLEGLPFRLGGVVQTVRDGIQVGIRFLDLSTRKREQLEQLIEEFEQASN